MMRNDVRVDDTIVCFLLRILFSSRDTPCFVDKYSGRWIGTFDVRFLNPHAEGSDEKHRPSCRIGMVEFSLTVGGTLSESTCRITFRAIVAECPAPSPVSRSMCSPPSICTSPTLDVRTTSTARFLAPDAARWLLATKALVYASF